MCLLNLAFAWFYIHLPTYLPTSARIAKLREIENKRSKFDSSAQDSIVNKSPETANLVQYHSFDILINESKVDGVITPESFDCNVSNLKQHPIRESNLLTDFNRSKKEKLQYPSVNDPIWKNINKEMEDALPQILNNHAMNNLPSQKLIEKLDNWTYEFLKEKFGIVPPPTDPKPTFVKKPNKRMSQLRIRKNNLRKAIWALERAGLKDSKE